MIEKHVNNKYVYSDLSAKIIGVAFDVFNEIGAGYSEKTYQRAMIEGFKEEGLGYLEEVPGEIIYRKKKVGLRRYDLIVADKVLVELKVGNRIARADFKQIYEYLNISKLKLGLIILFTSKDVRIRRIPNVKQFV